MVRNGGSETLRHHLLRCKTYVAGESPSPPLALQSPAFNTLLLVSHIRRVILPHFIPPNPRRENSVRVCNGTVREVLPDRNASACNSGH